MVTYNSAPERIIRNTFYLRLSRFSARVFSKKLNKCGPSIIPEPD